MNSISAGPLVLEPQITAHAAEMFAVLSDPAIYEFENAPPKSTASLAERFARLESRVSPDGAEQWLNWVIRLPGGELAGYVQATIARDRTAHIAYELASKFWRQGIGSAAVSAMLKELAVTYGVSICVATLKERNYRSRALLQSLGFESAGSSNSDELIMQKRISVVATPSQAVGAARGGIRPTTGDCPGGATISAEKHRGRIVVRIESPQVER